MMRSKLITLASFFWLFSNAQDTLQTPVNPKEKAPNSALYNYTSGSLNNLFNEQMTADAPNRFTVDFDFYGNSNAAPASFLFNMLFKNPISNALKDRVDNRLKTRLRYEDNMRAGATYRRYLKKWDGILILGYYHRQTRVIRGPKDAFGTIFYGNARYENKTADFTDIEFQNHIYNQYTIGILKKIDYGKYQMEYGVTGSVLQGINNQMIRTGNTTLYTAADGEYVDINYDLTFNTAKEGATAATDLNGAGASVDMHLAVMNTDKWRLSLDLSDMGYMLFKQNPTNYNGIKSIRFQGIVIPDLLNFGPQTFDTLNLDSALRANLPSKSNSEYNAFMPFTAQLAFSKPLLHNRLVLTAGLQYRFMKEYFVYGYAKANYFIRPDMVVSGSIGGGSYSMCNVGVEFSKRWRYFDFTVGSANLLGLAVPSYMPGTSLFLRLGSSF